MAFQLKIRFSGLCIFAVQAASGMEKARMHVLMPTTHGMHFHIPVLEFDGTHLLAPPATGPDPRAPSAVVAQLSLRNSSSEVPGDTLDTRICAELVRVGEAVPGKFVLPELFEKKDQPLLTARVTLHGGKMTRVAPGVCWRWVGGIHRRMAHVAEWIVEVAEPSLKWELKDFTGIALGRTVELFPMKDRQGQDVINVRVRHLPPENLAIEAIRQNPPIEAEHFGHYYSLLGEASVPLLPREPVEMNCPPLQDCVPIRFSGESAFNCMLGAG